MPRIQEGGSSRVVYFEDKDVFRTIYSTKYGSTTPEHIVTLSGVTYVTTITYGYGADSQLGPIQTHGPTVYRTAFYVGPSGYTRPQGWKRPKGIYYEKKDTSIPDIFGATGPVGPINSNLSPDARWGYDENGYPIYTSSEAALNQYWTRQTNMLFPVQFDMLIPGSGSYENMPAAAPVTPGAQARFRYKILKELHPDWSDKQIFDRITEYYRAGDNPQRPPAQDTPPPGVTQIGPLQYSGGSSYRDPGDDY